MTATLGSMTIGVSPEYTILVMDRSAEEAERMHDPLTAIQKSVQKIGTTYRSRALPPSSGSRRSAWQPSPSSVTSASLR